MLFYHSFLYHHNFVFCKVSVKNSVLTLVNLNPGNGKYRMVMTQLNDWNEIHQALHLLKFQSSNLAIHTSICSPQPTEEQDRGSVRDIERSGSQVL